MIQPKVDSQRPLTGPKAPASDLPVDKTAMAEAISGKFGAWGTHGSRAAGSAVRNGESGDELLMTADVLRSAGDAIKNRHGASKIGVVGETTVAIARLREGNWYRGAYHAGKAVEAMGKAVSQSRLGAFANALVLATSGEHLREAKKEVATSAQALMDESKDATARTHAFLDLSKATWQLAYLGRLVGKAASTVAHFGANMLAKSTLFSSVGLKAQSGMTRLAGTTVGKAFAGFTKWVPLLNIVGVAVSAKNMLDVYGDKRSSSTSKALAVGSLALAGAGLWGAISLGFWPFLGLAALGVGADVALIASMKRDQKRDLARKAAVRSAN